jgi:hypothetical protein
MELVLFEKMITGNPMVHYRVHNSQFMDSVHNVTIHILKIRFNIILPSMPRS